MRRLATERDIEEVFSIYMDKDVVPFLTFDPMPMESFRAIYREMLQSGCFFIYEVSGKIAGFYRASRHPGRAHHVAYIGTLAVSPKFQGRGTAREMMAEAIDRLVSAGVKRIELMVEADNPRAIRFYEKLGFEREGTQRKAYKRAGDPHYVDEYLMVMFFA